jgi:APA family basic amino acid/polyamine antiporter
MFTTLEEMVDLTNIGTLFAFFLVCVGIIILRVKEPNRERPFKVPFGIVLPILGAISCVGLAIYLPPSSWSRFFYWLLAGLVVYFLYGFKHSRLRTGALAAAGAPRHEVLHDFDPAARVPPRDTDEK